MTKKIVKSLVVISILFLPVSAFAAEGLKLKYGLSIYVDAKGNGLKLPEGVTCSEKPSLIVSDTGNGRLLKYTIEGGAVKGGDELRVAEISYPLRVLMNSKEEIFVLDGKQHRIIRLKPDGVFERYLDPSDVPAPASIFVKSFTVDSADNIYVLDVSSGRVLVLDPQGKFVRHVPFPEKYGYFSDLAVDPAGTIFLLDSVNAVVYSAGREAKGFAPLTPNLEEYANFPANIAVDGEGNIYLADQNGSGVIILGRNGSFRGRLVAFGWKDGLLRYPAQLCANTRGDLFIADKENSRIQMFSVIR
jgi:DNA-binding beta-propeller fold protein YncE